MCIFVKKKHQKIPECMCNVSTSRPHLIPRDSVSGHVAPPAALPSITWLMTSHEGGVSSRVISHRYIRLGRAGTGTDDRGRSVRRSTREDHSPSKYLTALQAAVRVAFQWWFLSFYITLHLILNMQLPFPIGVHASWNSLLLIGHGRSYSLHTWKRSSQLNWQGDA